MIIAKGLSPCLEFAAPENSFMASDNTIRFSGPTPGYYDNRYWTMWKLPMFGCTDAAQGGHWVWAPGGCGLWAHGGG
jgi:ribulose-bisphosphate carboxylase small chain